MNIPQHLRRSVTLPTPAVWPIDRLVELRAHIATQEPGATATMNGSFGPQSPIRRHDELLTVREALNQLDRYIGGKFEGGWNR